MQKVLVWVGTRKGGFIFESNTDRQTWSIRGPYFKGWTVMHMMLDPRDRRLHAAVAHDVYGAGTHYSDDLGHNWTQARVSPAFTVASSAGRPVGTPAEARDPDQAQSKPETVIKVWNITPGRASEPRVLYAGVEPAALFVSTDAGETWSLNQGLYQHPTRPQWYPGAGGLCLHTILLDPLDPQRMYVAISSAGCFRTDDGGGTWQPRNKNVRADFLPNRFPEFGQCVHKMDMHPNRRNVLYQQNHCGVYRSDNYGDEWIDIGEGKLPSRFGFPVVVHPHDANTLYVVLEESQEVHMSIEGQLAVWRSHDAGESWQRLSQGLPQQAYVNVLREAMAFDSCAQAGVYMGTNTGQIFSSRDEGDTWEVMADYLPPIVSIETAVVDA